jgi:excinuclease UvrABC nuclease subunit
MLADNFILKLDHIELKNKDLLPDCSCIYYVIDEQQIVGYVGRSINLRKRWNGENPHHRYNQLISISAKANQNF